jgi:cation transport ATPase
MRPSGGLTPDGNGITLPNPWWLRSEWRSMHDGEICCYPIYREAFEALRERRMTMDLSMTIALIAALSIREAFTAVVIVLFVLIAEVLEHMTVGRGRRAIRDLLDLLPRTVAVRRQEGVTDVSAGAIAVGDVVVIKPGGRVPVDGVVESGHSFVDQSAITGESPHDQPVRRSRGSHDGHRA